MKKILFILFLSTSIVLGSTWSLTMMTIATAEIIPTISSNMGMIIASQNSINNTYKDVRGEVEEKRKYITEISATDALILLELKNINFLLEGKKRMSGDD